MKKTITYSLVFLTIFSLFSCQSKSEEQLNIDKVNQALNGLYELKSGSFVSEAITLTDEKIPCETVEFTVANGKIEFDLTRYEAGKEDPLNIKYSDGEFYYKMRGIDGWLDMEFEMTCKKITELSPLLLDQLDAKYVKSIEMMRDGDCNRYDVELKDEYNDISLTADNSGLFLHANALKRSYFIDDSGNLFRCEYTTDLSVPTETVKKHILIIDNIK